MLAQFQSLYPTGSLTTELLQIHHGKYIVRSNVQIEGVTRASGMAAADTIEEAEDRSRARALMVLAMKTEETPAQVIEKETKTSNKQSLDVLANRSLTTAFTGAKESQTEVTSSPEDTSPKTPEVNQTSAKQAPETPPEETKIPAKKAPEITPETLPVPELISEEDNSDIYPEEFDKPLPIQTYDEPEIYAPVESLENPEYSEVEPLNQPQEEATTSKSSASKSSTGKTTKKTTKSTTSKRKKKPEPIDLSDVIAKTDVQMERLSWTPQQGREYLIKTYNKRGRTLLTEEELLDFLQHLESIPTPHPELSEADPLAGF